MINKQFFLFLASGGFAALANITSRWIFSLFLPYSIAIILAFICGLLSAFILFKRLVFQVKKKKDVFQEITIFIIVNLFGLAQTLFISLGLTEYVFPRVGWHFYAYDIAHIIGVLIPVFSSYIGHKYFTFRED